MESLRQNKLFGKLTKGIKRDVDDQQTNYVDEIFKFIEDPDADKDQPMNEQQRLNYMCLHQLQTAMNKRVNLPMDL